MSFQKSMGVLEAEAKVIIDRDVDETLSKLLAMGATPKEMMAANTIAKHVAEVINHGVAICQAKGGLDPARIHQLTLFIAARAEQAVSATMRPAQAN